MASSPARRAARDNCVPLSPAAHFDTIHGAHQRPVACLTIHRGEATDRTLPKAETRFICEVAGDMPATDVYFSQSAFSFRRTLAHVAVLPAAWIDLDHYKMRGMAHLSPAGLLAHIMASNPWLPMPTMLVSSGRGCYLQWVFTRPLQPRHLPEWQAVTDYLIEALKPFGADPACRDATRVLRVVGSVNQKNGATVTGQMVGGPIDFSELQKAVILHRLATQKAQTQLAPTPPAPAPAPSPPPPAEPAPSKKRIPANQQAALLGPYRLHRARFNDFQTLAKLRGPMTDCRARLLFCLAVSLAWFVGGEDDLKRELEDFAQEHFLSAAKYGPKRVRAVIERMKLDAGRIVIPVWQGARVPNRYRMTNAYILELLEITADEQTHMTTIISPEEKKRRRVEARRAAGMRTQEDRQKEADERKARALELAEQGMRQSAIAAEIGVGQQRVSRILKTRAGHEYKDHQGVTVNTTPTDHDRAHELRSTGHSIRAIAAELRKSVGYVHKLLNQE